MRDTSVDSSVTIRIGQRIKELRKQHGLSQVEFANLIGMGRSYLAEVEVGKRNIAIRNLEKVAHGFELSLSEFFDSELFDDYQMDSSQPMGISAPSRHRRRTLTSIPL